MHELCDYMLSWTLEQYEKEEYQEEGQQISLEVRDRAISAIGIGVPLGLYITLLICIIGAGWAMFDVARGRRK